MQAFYLFVFVVTILHLSNQQNPNLAPFHALNATFAECVQETGISPKLEQEILSPAPLTNDKRLKCFVKCVLSNFGFLTDTGMLMADALAADVTRVHIFEASKAGKVAGAINKCKDLKGSDLCETAFVFLNCLKKNVYE